MDLLASWQEKDRKEAGEGHCSKTHVQEVLDSPIGVVKGGPHSCVNHRPLKAHCLHVRNSLLALVADGKGILVEGASLGVGSPYGTRGRRHRKRAGSSLGGRGGRGGCGRGGGLGRGCRRRVRGRRLGSRGSSRGLGL